MRWMLQHQVHTKVQALKKEIELDMREYDGKRNDPGSSEERFLVYSGPFRLLF